ncbi:unnamed protein product, partial [Closterium sp. NIES-54]
PCTYVLRTGTRSGKVCGLPHTTQRCLGRLTDAWRTQFPDAVELPRWHDLLLQNVLIFDLDFDAFLAAMYALADITEGDCYLSVLPDLGTAAAALGASAAASLGASASAAPDAGTSTLSGTAPTESLHTFTLDSGASRSFFRDSTTLTPLSRSVAVSLADPSGGPVLAHSSTVLSCPAAPSGLLSGLHLPSFSTNLVSGADLQDAWVDQFTPGGQRVTHCTCSRTGCHLATFTRWPGSSLYTLTTAPPPVPASGQVAASSQVFAAASRSSPASAPCSCRPLAHETLLWHHRLGHPSLPRLRGMASRALVSGLPRSLPPLPLGPAPTCVPCVEGRQRAAPHSSSFPPTEAPLQTLHMDVKGEVPEVLIDWIRGARRQLSESFGSDLTVLRLHSDRGGEFSSDLLRAFCRSEGICQTFTLPASPQQNGIAERRIGMVMDVARTSMIHAAAPHFLWPFAVQYAAHQINLQPRVSLPETTHTLRWTGKVGDASAFRVWGSRDFVRDTTAEKLSSRAGPAPSGVSQVDPAEPVEVAVDSGATRGAEPVGAGPGGAEPERVEPGDAESGGAESWSAELGGAEPGGVAPTRPYYVLLLQQVLGSPPSPPPPFLSLPPVQSQSQLQLAPPLPSPCFGPTRGLTKRLRAGRVSRPRLPPLPSTNSMTLRPSTAPQRVPLPSPPASSLPDGPDPESDSLRAASPTVTRVLATAIPDPLFESSAASALVAELIDFDAACRLDYAASLVAASASVSICPPSVGGECALGTDVLEDRQEEFECFAASVPHLVSMLLAPEGAPDALDIPIPRSYAEAIEGPYSSQWQAAMDAEMASWTSTGTYVDEVPPPGANIVSGMWIFRVKRPPGSPPAFKARYIARGFIYGLRQAPREWHDTIWTTLASLGFASSTADHSLFLRTDTTLPPFYVLMYVDGLVFATADTEALAHMKSKLQNRHTCTVLAAPLEPSRAALPEPSCAALPEPSRATCTGPSRPTCLWGAPTAFPPTAAITLTTPMASPPVLAFDAEGRPVKFETLLDDLHLFLQLTAKEDISLYDHALGHATAPAATADSTARSQWQTRDAHARFAIRNSLPIDEREHFGQHKTAQALYTAVVARYSSPLTGLCRTRPSLSSLPVPRLSLVPHSR